MYGYMFFILLKCLLLLAYWPECVLFDYKHLHTYKIDLICILMTIYDFVTVVVGGDGDLNFHFHHQHA